MGQWGSLHTHSQYSAIDGMTPVPKIVAKAKRLQYPFLGLTDHGTMAGTTKLYKECKRQDILPYPGVELYVIDPFGVDEAGLYKDAGRYHLTALARTTRGYQALVKLVSLSHTRPRFHRYPRVLWDDLMEMGEDHGDDVIILTGCFFGLIQQFLIKDSTARASSLAKELARRYHTMVEIQNHCITQVLDGIPVSDDTIVPALVAMADNLGLPIMATQDSHYLDREDKKAHALMKRMVYGNPDDAFPGDSYHLASEPWIRKHYDKETWNRVLETCKILVEINEVTIPALDDYRPRVPRFVDNKGRYQSNQEHLERVCNQKLQQRQLNKKKYWQRLVYELSVISQLGMADYFLLVAEEVRWCSQRDIVVEARGSANGSLVCFLLGITQVDPIKWNLLFERFLSADRTQPPDIDLDIEDTRRDEVIKHLEEKYRDRGGVTRIGTWGLLGSNDQDQGSVLVTYKTFLAKKLPPEQRSVVYARYQTIQDVIRDYPEDGEGLLKLSAMGSVFRSYGVHAAGILLPGDELRWDAWIPTMLIASSETTATQLDHHDCEDWGFLKIDWLGQATLSVMRKCLENIGRKNATDFSWIPEDDKETFKVLREGRTETGIFHFEGFTKAKGGKELGIKSLSDVILAQALYMPGATSTGQKDLYIQRRRNKEERDRVIYLHPAFENALKSTYGTVIFQEQVINIMRGLGMGIPAINKFFKVVKDSGRGATTRNQERLAEVREEFTGADRKSVV